VSVSLAPIEPALAEAASFLDATLDTLLPQPKGPEARLVEAMRYAALGSGRRWRGFLVLQSGRLFGVDRRASGRVAAAVECLHAYARVHDDLPAIDDAHLRRGREALHKAYDEASAILAGDALLTFAFGLIASPEAHGDPYVRCELIAKLASAAGHGGLTGGQAMELSLSGTPPLPEITRLSRMKTAALVTFCCESGAIMGKSSAPARAALAAYGQELGLAYQIANNLLDVQDDTGDDMPDRGRARPSIVSVMGAERARAQAGALAAQAEKHLESFDEKADLLRAAARYAVQRSVDPSRGR
jgi:farnesyl diphosphate synthase